MNTSVHHSEPPRTAEEARRQIESLLDELAELAESAVPRELFYGQLLDRLTFATSGLGAGLWIKGPTAQLVLAQKVELQSVYPVGQAAQALADDQAQLWGALASGQGSILPGSRCSSLRYEILAVPIQAAGEVWGALALYHDTGLPASVKDAYLRIARAFAEVARHYQQQALLREFQQHRADWKRHLDFADHVHADLGYRHTAYRIANQGRNSLDVDRVAVLSLQRHKAVLEAISGVDRPNRRSNVVRKLERLAATILQTRQPLIYTGDTEDLPPQVEQRLLDYLEESPSKVVAVLPLEMPTDTDPSEETDGTESLTRPSTPQVFGALVIESIDQLDPAQLLRRSAPIVRHAATALGNAKKHQQIPLAPLLLPLGRGLATLGWYRLGTTLKLLISLLILIAALFFIPTDFTIEVHGKLVPALERNIFAPADGYVEEIFVQHGDWVEPGAPLIQLHSSEFTLRRTEIVGQMQVAQAELDAILVKRSQGMRRDPRASSASSVPQSLENLSADQQRLTTQIENLTQQRDLLQRRQDELRLVSPIVGQVLNWEVEQILAARPVSRGELLLKVADVDGPWVLKLQLPDRRTHHVLKAQGQADEPLGVRFHLVNQPGKQYHGTLAHTAAIVDWDEKADQPFVPLEATFDKSKIPHLRHGLSVVGRIECGQRSIAYVWTYQLVETIRRHLFW